MQGERSLSGMEIVLNKLDILSIPFTFGRSRTLVMKRFPINVGICRDVDARNMLRKCELQKKILWPV